MIFCKFRCIFLPDFLWEKIKHKRLNIYVLFFLELKYLVWVKNILNEFINTTIYCTYFTLCISTQNEQLNLNIRFDEIYSSIQTQLSTTKSNCPTMFLTQRTNILYRWHTITNDLHKLIWSLHFKFQE